MVGLTVFNFTLIMSVLLAAAFFSLYIFTIKIVDNKILASLGFCGILFYNYLFPAIRSGYDPYFQYFPLRILFPSLIVLTAYFYFKDKNIKFYYLSIFLSILSMFWNFETGLVVFLTWLIALAYQEILEKPIKPALIRIAKHIAINIYLLSIAVIAFTIYIYIRFGSYPLFSDLLGYQRIFYYFGFNMIPMSLIHPWNIIILIYFIGIAHSAKYLIMRNDSIRTKMIFFLSILGIGVFGYYQGRSHNQVLLDILYPALLLLIICMDDLYSKISHSTNVSKKTNFMHVAVFIGIIFFFISADFSLLSNCGDLGERIDLRVDSLLKAEPTEVTNNSDFIKSHTIPGEKVLIISGNEGVYHLQSKTLSSFNGPGFTELFLRSDYNNLLKVISDNESNYKVFVDQDSYSVYPYMTQLFSDLQKNYNATDVSKNGQIILLEKVKNNAEAWNNKGVALGTLGDYADAINAYDEAIRLEPSFAEAWNNKGIALDSLGNYTDAIRAYDEAIRLKPSFAEAWNNRGIALGTLGDYADAIKSFDEAIRIDPNLALTWNNKGIALDSLGNYTDAIKAYDEAIRLEPNLAETWDNKGIALKNLGRTCEADAAFAKARELGYAG